MNAPELSRSARRFKTALAARGHEIDVVALSDSTRTAQAAADTIGCDVAQAAGTPFSVFQLAPNELPAITGADWHDVALSC